MIPLCLGPTQREDTTALYPFVRNVGTTDVKVILRNPIRSLRLSVTYPVTLILVLIGPPAELAQHAGGPFASNVVYMANALPPRTVGDEIPVLEVEVVLLDVEEEL